MALFPNVQGGYTFKGKSHTNLVISEGMAPAEDFMISRLNTAEPFIYEFGPEGNQTCILAKGKIVEVAGTEYDREDDTYKCAIKQSGDASTKVLGVNFHNVYERRRGFMHSTLTKPVVITRNYIEVPLFEHATKATATGFAKAMRFGAAVSSLDTTTVEVGEEETIQVSNQIMNGDYVTSDADGNFRKWIEGKDKAQAIVGQVFAKETELPPAGFLQYYKEIVHPDMEAFLKQMSYAPSPGRPENGAAFPYGHPYTVRGWKPEFTRLLTDARAEGIPFLTDGFFRAQETKSFTIGDADMFERITGTEAVEITGSTVRVLPGHKNPAIFLKLAEQLDKTQLDKIVAQTADGIVGENDIHVDLTNNTIVIYFPINEGSSAVTVSPITLTVPLVIDPIAGIPTEWDHRGSVGAIRILLQR